MGWRGRAGRGVTIATVTMVALTGCAYVRQVSTPAADAQIGAYDGFDASGNGRYVVYATDREVGSSAHWGVHLLDTATNVKELISIGIDGEPADDWSGNPAITPDGRYVAFESDAENLVAGDTNLTTDVFVRDRVAKTTTRVSVASNGAESDDWSYDASISDDGRYVAFTTDSDLLATNDQNGESDIFVHDRQTKKTTLVSISGYGQTDFGAWDGVISGDGRYVAFTTDTELAAADENGWDDVYLRNLAASSTTWVSRPKAKYVAEGGGGGEQPSISYDGQLVAFTSDSYEHDDIEADVNGDDVFVRNTTTATTTRISVGPTGGILPLPSFSPTISADGRRIGFLSAANVTGTDTNGSLTDLYVRDLTTNRTALVSTNPDLVQRPAPVTAPVLSDDGRYGYWRSSASFHASDKNTLGDVYFRAVDVPKITTIAPATVARGGFVDVTITGSTFLPGAQAFTVEGPVLSNLVVVSDTTITARVAAPAGLAPGLYSVYVTNMGTGPGPNSGATAECAGCVRVT